MALLKKANVDLETRGIEFDYGGIKVRLARMGNPNYQAMVRRLTKKYALKSGVSMQDLSVDDFESISKEAFARTIIVGWSEMELEEGQPREYSWEEALDIISNPEYHAFYTFCQTQSQNRANFESQLEEDDAKNS